MLALVLFLKEVLRSPSKRFWDGATRHKGLCGELGLKTAEVALQNAAEPPLFSWLFINQ